MFKWLNEKIKLMKKKRTKDYLIYEESRKYSREAVTNCKFDVLAMEYKSPNKMTNFIDDCGVPRITKETKNNQDTFGVEVGLNVGNNKSEIKASLGGKRSYSKEVKLEYDSEYSVKDIRTFLNVPNNKIDNCFDVKEGNYFKIRFPVLGGKLNVAMYKKYPNTYWWYGKYRNIELFLCGNIKNVIRENCNNIDDYEWDPSEQGSSKILFDDIEDYNTKNIEDNSEGIISKIDFITLSSYINKSTARSYNKNFGWKDFLAICDKIERKDGFIRIFGSPIVVTAKTNEGYGWYNVEHDNKKTYKDSDYYEFSGEKFTGRVLSHGNEVDFQNKKIYCFTEKDFHNIYKSIVVEKDENDESILKRTKIPVVSYNIKSKEINSIKNSELKDKISNCNDIIGICLTTNFFKD